MADDQQTTPSALAERVRNLKERHGWTWDELARRVGVTAGTIRQWRLGLIHQVRPSVIRRIEELEVTDEVESEIVQLDPQWRDTLRQAKQSVERILLSRNRTVIEHLISTLEVLQNYVEATEERPEGDTSRKPKKGAKGDREAD